MQTYLDTLEKEFLLHQNLETATKQKAYLKNQFEHFGLTATERRAITKPFFDKAFLPSKTKLPSIVIAAWNKPQRDFHHFAQELVFRYKKDFEETDIELMEYMITHKSWWDSVDYIGMHLVKNYFKKFPNKKPFYIDKWLVSDNIWLQRTTIYCQLKDKTKMDLQLLTKVIKTLAPSKEFFIKKAIGTILREYSRIDDRWVVDFVKNNQLSNLSKREALRLLS